MTTFVGVIRMRKQKQKHLHEQQVVVHVCGRVHEKGLQEKLKLCNHTERKVMQQCDQLTGSYNKHLLVSTATKWLEEAALEKQEIVCATLDIDHFDALNQLYGRAVANQALVHLANVCEELLEGECAFVARFGADEFMIFWRHCSFECGIEQAINLFTHIQQSELICEERIIPLSISMGIAHNEFGAIRELQELLNLAEEALEQSKRNGRNQYSII